MYNKYTYSIKVDARPKYITEDAENRVYVSLIRVRKKPPNWQQAAREFLPKLAKLSGMALRLLIAFSIAFGTALAAFHMAYAERGYTAIGGEYLLVIGVFLLAYWLVGKVIGKNGGEDDK